MQTCGQECGSCSHPCTPVQANLVCRCLGVDEESLVKAIVELGLRTVREIRNHTGAGDGCNACHKRLSVFLGLYATKSAPTTPLAMV